MADEQLVWKEPITASVRILYWLDIPSKVEVEDEAGVVTRSLSDRYQNLIHKLETRAGDGTSVGQWREAAAFMRPGDANTVAMQVIDELEREFDQIAAHYAAHLP